MLEKYKTSQSLAYNILNNAILYNKLSHAYLIDSNGNSDAFDIALGFAKIIITNNLDGEEKENICRRIDENNYLDLKIIETDGIWIKKDELVDIQNEFSKKAIEGKKKVYIIKNAEKMNVQTANSILKFLEEPIDDIIAILIVNNINLLLPTILSRCQIIKLERHDYLEDSISNFFNLFFDSDYGKISSDEANNIIQNVFDFALFMQENGLDTLIYSKRVWHSIFKDRLANIMGLELLINIYIDALRNKAGLDVNFFKDKLDMISKISSNNSIDMLSKKVEIVINAKNDLKRNLNINLLIDKMIIDMCGDKR